jgi:hypothetical protein
MNKKMENTLKNIYILFRVLVRGSVVRGGHHSPTDVDDERALLLDEDDRLLPPPPDVEDDLRLWLWPAWLMTLLLLLLPPPPPLDREWDDGLDEPRDETIVDATVVPPLDEDTEADRRRVPVCCSC